MSGHFQLELLRTAVRWNVECGSLHVRWECLMDEHLRKMDFTSESTADAPGLWFAAAGLCAFLAAGAIVYQTGNSDVRTVSNDGMVASAQSGPALRSSTAAALTIATETDTKNPWNTHGKH